MKKSTRNFVLAAMLVGIMVTVLTARKVPDTGGETRSSGQKISWLMDLTPALAKGRESGQPIMIDFYADWCGPCKMLDAQTYSNDQVAAASTNWVMVRIDVDRNQGLAQEYRVSSIPTIVVLSPEGKEVQRRVGFIAAAPMLKMMEQGK